MTDAQLPQSSNTGGGINQGLNRDTAPRLAAEYGGRPDDAAKDDPLDVAVWQASPTTSSRPGGAQPRRDGVQRLVPGDALPLVLTLTAASLPGCGDSQ